MALPPRLRKLALTAHVTASVGWLGAVIAFLNLSVTGLTSQNPQTVRGAYLSNGADRPGRPRPLGPGLTTHRAHLLPGQHLGPVPALLGPVQARHQPRRHNRLAALYADPRLPGRRRGGNALGQSWASRAAGPIANAARRRRPPAPAGGHRAGHLQAPRHDPLRAAHPTPATPTPPTVTPATPTGLPLSSPWNTHWRRHGPTSNLGGPGRRVRRGRRRPATRPPGQPRTPGARRHPHRRRRPLRQPEPTPAQPAHQAHRRRRRQRRLDRRPDPRSRVRTRPPLDPARPPARPGGHRP